MKKLFEESGTTIDACLLQGKHKVWLWENYVMGKVSWLFLIHDVVPSFVKTQLQPIQTRWYKRWFGYPLRANTTIFYRSRANHGLQLKQATQFHIENRLIRRHILSTSNDPQVRAIHQHVNDEQSARHKSGTNEFKDCVLLNELLEQAKFEKRRGPLKLGKSGLGFGNSCVIDMHGKVSSSRCKSGPTGSLSANATNRIERETILRIFREEKEREMVVGVITNLQHFGEWVKWNSALQIDTSWHNLLSRFTDQQLRFRMCATEDVLPTESVLNCWNLTDTGGMCPLGCKANGSLRHILCGCRLDEGNVKGKQSRITWRHDSILLAICRAVMSVSKRLGEGPPAPKPNTVGVFQSENGAKSLLAPVRKQVKGPVLTQTSDWEFVFDLEHEELGHSKSRRGFTIVSIE